MTFRSRKILAFFNNVIYELCKEWRRIMAQPINPITIPNVNPTWKLLNEELVFLLILYWFFVLTFNQPFGWLAEKSKTIYTHALNQTALQVRSPKSRSEKVLQRIMLVRSMFRH